MKFKTFAAFVAPSVLMMLIFIAVWAAAGARVARATASAAASRVRFFMTLVSGFLKVNVGF